MGPIGRAKGARKPSARKKSGDEESFARGDDAQQRQLLEALQAARRGDFAVRLPVRGGDARMNEIATEFNALVGLNETLAKEIVRVHGVVGREGRMAERVAVSGTAGDWASEVNAINALIGDLVQPTTEVARVLSAVAEGDLSQKMALSIEGQPVKGEFLRIGTTVNKMVDQLSSFAAEVARVAKEVGSDGKLGGQAEVPEAAGTWRDLTDNVNRMASNLTDQVRNIAEVSTSVANGDLSKKITVDARGEVLELKNTINTMVDQLNSFAAEVTRVAKEVGTEGELGGQADVKGVSGVWKHLTDNVNFMASNLTGQVRNIALVTTAVANGDLSKKITVDVKGEVLQLKDTINTMVDQLNTFAGEVTRVAREVGTEGKLGGQAEVEGVSGTWKDLTDNVNFMASNLTTQVRGIARVVTAVANGDLSQRLKVEAKGEVAALADTINDMTGTLSKFAEQVTDVARTVGVEGKLGVQADVPGVSGTWKDLTDNVNVLAGNLTDQVRNIADVTTAVARGDLSKKITVDVRGEVLELKDTINTMVDQLNTFAGEVTRVAKEVGTDGKLGGQAEVKGVSGTWKDLTDNVNFMASNLTGQVRNIALVTTAVANGDLSKKITVDVRGEILELKDTINTMVDQLNSFASEVTRVAREVGTDGKLGGQADVKGVAGVWKNLTDNVNFMASNLTTQVRGIVKVVTAVANGELQQKLSVDAKGEIAALAETINNMTDTLSTFAQQVSTVAREVGVEGKLGGQARVPGVAGTWKDLTDNVNFMASNLTTQVRGIVKVVTAVANGELSQKLTGVDAKGEIAALADTINGMTDTLGTFADQVSTVAREVGIEGKLGGQAKVPGAMGTWRQLTDNVNQLAGNLTSQVRAIADVATAVTKGDLTRSITVDAAGEVAALKDNVNQMIVNLKETTQKNQEQDWLKTNLAKFSSMLQGQKNLEAVSRLIMSELTPLVSAHQGSFLIMEQDANAEPMLKLTATYAYRERKQIANHFRVGEGLVGQCALERKTIVLTQVPGDYIQISSSLGESPPFTIIVLPVLFEGAVKAVIELASFQPFSPIHQLFLDQLTESIGVVLNMISANMRTEELLQQSQGLTQDLQSQSRYKSEFLANMSHELRTPLNSLLILAKLLADNPDANLTPKQIEYARTIHASGGDLLSLINEILDLSKVEAGKMRVEPRDIAFTELKDVIDRGFRPVAEQKALAFEIELAEGLPYAIRTDPQRLQQVLKNLLSNAFKFTDHGEVSLRISAVDRAIAFDNPDLWQADGVIAFAVRDTGIGIARDKQRLIFEAFQQADGTTSRKYGGTGLGLSISREIAKLLGGEIRVESTPGKGTTFTLFLPKRFFPADLSLPKTSPLSAERRRLSDTALFVDEITENEPRAVGDGTAVGQRSTTLLADRLVLVVDDDPRNIFVLTTVLERWDVRVLVAENGREALAALEAHPDIELVLMDIMMPEMDGYETMKAMRGDPRYESLPIIAVTAKALKEDRDRCIAAGATDYLPKPVQSDELEEMLRRWIAS